MVHLADVAGISSAIAPNREWALGGGVDLAVSRAERGQEKEPTFETLGIAHRRDRDVELHSRTGERRQGRCHKNRSHIVHARRARRNLHAHTLQSIGQGLDGENGLPAITGTLQSDHDAVADKRVIAHAFDRRDVPDERLLTLLLCERSREHHPEAHCENKKQSVVHRRIPRSPPDAATSA